MSYSTAIILHLFIAEIRTEAIMQALAAHNQRVKEDISELSWKATETYIRKKS